MDYPLYQPLVLRGKVIGETKLWKLGLCIPLHQTLGIIGSDKLPPLGLSPMMEVGIGPMGPVLHVSHHNGTK